MIVLCVIPNCHFNPCGTSAVNDVSHHISSPIFFGGKKLRYFLLSFQHVFLNFSKIRNSFSIFSLSMN